ncbi:MAG: universal stress protein [Syntrophobacterales bacterium]|jgi:nucleotide-binding universal stress UspA family protein
MHRFKSILLMHDRRPGHQSTIKRGVDLARRNRARLTVVDVIEEDSWDSADLYALAQFRELQEFVSQERQKDLDIAIEPIKEQGVDVRAKLLYGEPFLEIIREVLRENHDLVIKTAQGEGGLKGMLFGSTAMHLMRKCPCPVWVVKRQGSEQYERIIAAVDPDSSVEQRNSLTSKIMELATSLAKLEQSELLVVHAWSLYGETLLRGGAGRMDQKEIDRLVREAKATHEARLNNLVDEYDLQNLNYRVHLIKGDAGRVIPELAEKKQAELIVMGTLSRSGVAGFFIGNSAEKILHKVDCSVLTVKPDGFVSPVKLG